MKPKLPKNRVPVSVSIPFDKLAIIDSYAFSQGQSRSDFLLQAGEERIARLQNVTKEEKGA